MTFSFMLYSSINRAMDFKPGSRRILTDTRRPILSNENAQALIGGLEHGVITLQQINCLVTVTFLV